jgi:phosphonate transport system substrate-binding protein
LRRGVSTLGQLDTLYCDADGDLVADAPTDPSRWRNPSTMVWAYTPVEDPAVYADIFKPFTDHLEACVGKRFVYYPVQSNTAQIEAMRSGRLHFAAFSTGPTGFAVNMAGADSSYQQLSDLKGARVAHSSPSSNSGNLAPRVLFPEFGLTPDEDYTPLMSGSHDNSVLGVASKDYDMGAVASDVLLRMAERGTVRIEDFRVLYESAVFPTNAYAHAHDLEPELAAKLRQCVLDFKFPKEMSSQLSDAENFLPITYQEHWKVVRDVAEKSGTPYNKAAYEEQMRRDAEKKKN